MKKKLASFVFAAVLAAGLAAEDFSLSAGVEALLGYTFTRYTLESEGSMSAGDPGDIKSLQSMDRFNYGGGLFFDATYAEFTILLQGGQNSYGETMDFKPRGKPWAGVSNDLGTGTETLLGFTLLGKYPFAVTEKLSLFPLVGIEYQVALREWRKPKGDKVYDRTGGILAADMDKNGDPYPLSAWNSFWIDIGAGVDYYIWGPFFLRAEVLFGFRLMTEYETGALEMTKAQFNSPDPKLVGLTGGPNVRISAGYKFFSGGKWVKPVVH
ncbi:MAG: hypothetical protein LBJ90_06730 [Treponema sp.]|jgi:hypothetical protein|nr:hypothetical protein [Treponema sp.]